MDEDFAERLAFYGALSTYALLLIGVVGIALALL
jgi:hypothetical protein